MLEFLLSPPLLLMLGSLALAGTPRSVMPQTVRRALLLALPVYSLWRFWGLPIGDYAQFEDLRADADPHADRQTEPRLCRHLPPRGVHRHHLLALRQGQLPAAGRGLLCRIGPWRGPGRRPLDPVPVLGGRGGVVGAPGLGSPRRPGARGGPALSRHADGLGGPAAGRHRPAAPRPGRGARLVRVPQSHGPARRRRHRLRQSRPDPDSLRLRSQGRLPTASQLADRRLPRVDAGRGRVPLGLHHQVRDLRPGARLPGPVRADLDRGRDDRVPDLLRRDRERPAPGCSPTA